MKTTDRRKGRALITGASSGIGKEMAGLLAKKNYSLILIARSEDKLKKITGEIKNRYNIECDYFVCDLSKETEVERLIDIYPEVDLLINNAGSADYGFYHKSSWEKTHSMIMLNVVTICRLCHYYLQGMVKRNFGRILNVASTAGLTPTPFMSIYSGTKAFLIQFTKSLALELRDKNVTVSCLLPGSTNTNFWNVSNIASKVEGSITRFSSPLEVAEFGIGLLEKGKMSGIPGWQNKLKSLIKYHMPQSIWAHIIRRHMFHESLFKDINS